MSDTKAPTPAPVDTQVVRRFASSDEALMAWEADFKPLKAKNLQPMIESLARALALVDPAYRLALCAVFPLLGGDAEQRAGAVKVVQGIFYSARGDRHVEYLALVDRSQRTKLSARVFNLPVKPRAPKLGRRRRSTPRGENGAAPVPAVVAESALRRGAAAGPIEGGSA